MIKKAYWLIPSIIIGVGAIAGGATAGYLVNSNSVFNELRTYTAIPTGISNDALIQSYLAAAVNGTKLISAPGFTHTAPITQALAIAQNQNPAIYKYMNKTGFLLLDDKYGSPIFNSNNEIDTKVNQPVWSTNVASAQFRTDLGTFIVGIGLGEFLNEYQYYFATDEDGKLTYGTYGGDNFSSVTSFMGGLQRGINFFNEYIVPYAKNSSGQPYLPIEQVILGNGYQQNFSGGFGTTDGNSLINQFLNQKVDALMPVAGDQTTQAVRMIKQNNLRTIVLGVDSASELNTNANQTLPISGYKDVNGSKAIGGTNNIIQFSSLKKLDQITLQITNNINNNVSLPTEGSTIGGFGYHSLGNVANNCVGISNAGYQYFIRAIKLFMASYGMDPNNPDANIVFDSQSVIDDSQIQSIFEIPNNNPNVNIPTTEEYKNYYTDNYYNQYVHVLTQTETYKQLDLPEYKKYILPGNDITCSYADIPNTGSQMMPLNIEELDQWFEQYVAGSDPSVNEKKLNSLKQWFKDNEETINIRKEFNLENQLNKEDWESNNTVIKVALNAPNISLLDKSFNESAFDGLILYWKSKGITISKPH